MKNASKRIALCCICIVLAIAIVVDNIPNETASAASTTSNITVASYIKLLTKASGAKKSDLVKEGEFENTSSKITNENAALLADRADTFKNGNKYSEDLYNQVVDKKRISDISKASKSKKEAIYRCFVKGIMVGKSNGAYTQTRKVSPKGYLTVGDATTIANRIKSKSKRIKLSYDGQVIRTTNLPKNYKSYSYILASFPNSFYEHKFNYQVSNDSLKDLTLYEDYAPPVKLKKVIRADYKIGESLLTAEGDKVMENLMTNLKYRLNYNYKTTDKKKWISTMASTYNESDVMVKMLKEYTKYAEERKVVVQSSQIVIEPSATSYYSSDVIFRGHARIKVTAGKFETWQSNDQNAMVFGYGTWFKSMKNGKWYDFDFEVCVTSGGVDQYFPDYRIPWITDCMFNLSDFND